MCATAPWSGEPGLYGEKRLSGRPQTEAVVQPSLPGMRGSDVNLGDHEEGTRTSSKRYVIRRLRSIGSKISGGNHGATLRSLSVLNCFGGYSGIRT
jgi:hypothetical protein